MDLPVTNFEFIIHVGLVCIIPWLISVVIMGITVDWSEEDDPSS